MQSLPLEAKIIMTKRRIRDWYEYWDGQVYVSFSGGKDSTVLKHIVDSMYDDVPAVFVNTGLEYPELQTFVRDIKKRWYTCFNSDVVILRPEMSFDEVIKKYGYPVVSKETSRTVQYGKRAIKKGINGTHYALDKLRGEAKTPEGRKSPYNCEKWEFLLDAPFDVSAQCCDVMKKKPAKFYEKRTERKPILGTLASESRLRHQQWVRYGCNAYQGKLKSAPLSFWTENDILEYLVKYNVPYCSVYGEIKQSIEGKYYTTGCAFCMFGCHLEKSPNRFQRMKETHPRQYAYCINGGEENEGKWQPSKDGLGLGKVLDFIGVAYK